MVLRLQFEHTQPFYYSLAFRVTLFGERSFVVEQMREPFPDIAWLVKVAGDAVRAPADGERLAAEVGHDGEHGFVGDVIADEHRAAALERPVGHQLAHPARLVEAGMLDL